MSMKANDLMVGDYLMRNGFPYRVIQVDGIVRDGWMIENGEEDCGEPIPITPEILEKNGFVIKKKWAQIGNFGDSPLIMWHFEDDAVLGDFKHELEIHQNDTGKVHVHIPCDYVHQFQHALRLCGIEKTIEL